MVIRYYNIQQMESWVGQDVPRFTEREKGRYLTTAMTKAPTPTEKSKKQRDNTKMPPNTSITLRSRTDVGRSVGGTAATQMVRLNRFTESQPSH